MDSKGTIKNQAKTFAEHKTTDNFGHVALHTHRFGSAESDFMLGSDLNYSIKRKTHTHNLYLRKAIKVD